MRKSTPPIERPARALTKPDSKYCERCGLRTKKPHTYQSQCLEAALARIDELERLYES